MTWDKLTWDQMIAAHRALGARRNRAWQSFIARTTRLAALADPRTGGNENLCRNWGNEESKRIWSDAWERWRSYSNRIDARHNALRQAALKSAA